MFGIVTGETIASNYFEVEEKKKPKNKTRRSTFVFVQDATSLFVGSMILAQAMQYVQLHRRLILFVLNYVGSTMKWLVEIHRSFLHQDFLLILKDSGWSYVSHGFREYVDE